MELKLKILEGANAGQEVAVKAPKFFIGRAEDCQLRPHSDLISRHHCVITFDGTSAVIRDFGSKNGTYVNGERVIGEQSLAAGDRIQVGPLWFEIVLTTGIGGGKRPAVKSVSEAVARMVEASPSGNKSMEDWLLDSEAETVVRPLNPSHAETQAVSLNETLIVRSPTETTSSSKPASPISRDDSRPSGSSAGKRSEAPPQQPSPAGDAGFSLKEDAVTTSPPEPEPTSASEPVSEEVPKESLPSAKKQVRPEHKPNYYVPEPHVSSSAGDESEKDRPQFGKSKSADSSSAAQDTLRRLFGRR